MNFLRMWMVVVLVLPGGLRCAAAAASIAHGVDETDPISGLHWLRLTDPEHPAAPPRLRLGRNDRPETGRRVVALKRPPCVHAGDRVWVRRDNEGGTALSVEATALGSGSPGDHVRARIIVTGALVEMSISGPDEGILSRAPGGWR